MEIAREKDIQRAKADLDNFLGLTSGADTRGSNELDKVDQSKAEYIKASLDQILGLSVEMEHERKQRELDETLRLRTTQ